MPMVPLQSCFQKHPPLGPAHQPPQGIPCSTCNKMHPRGPRICWVESGVTCANCSGNHPTDRCRRSNLGHSQGNPYNNPHPQGNTNFICDRQVQRFQPNQPRYGDNGQQPSYQNQSYNHGTNWNQGLNRDGHNLNFGHNQNQARGQVRLGHPHQPNTQDARYVDVNSMDPMGNSDPILQNTLVVLHKHKPMVSSTPYMGLGKTMADAVVMTKAQRFINPPTEHMAKPSTPSDGSPNLA